MSMGPNFLTHPDPTKYPTDPTQTDPRIFGKDTTRTMQPGPNLRQFCGSTFQMSIRPIVLYNMHVKINTKMRHKSEHTCIININLENLGFLKELLGFLGF